MTHGCQHGSQWEAEKQRILNGPDTPGRRFLEGFERQKAVEAAKEAKIEESIQQDAERLYICKAGHITRLVDMDRTRCILGCCPKCPTIDACEIYVPDVPEPAGQPLRPPMELGQGPIQADFDNDPELQDQPESRDESREDEYSGRDLHNPDDW